MSTTISVRFDSVLLSALDNYALQAKKSRTEFLHEAVQRQIEELEHAEMIQASRRLRERNLLVLKEFDVLHDPFEYTRDLYTRD
jgi:predicted transcriptional regulator